MSVDGLACSVEAHGENCPKLLLELFHEELIGLTSSVALEAALMVLLHYIQGR